MVMLSSGVIRSVGGPSKYDVTTRGWAIFEVCVEMCVNGGSGDCGSDSGVGGGGGGGSDSGSGS